MTFDPHVALSDRQLRPGIVLGVTLDTKQAEIRLMRDELARLNLAAIVIDCGVLGQPEQPGDITAAEVAVLGGSTIESLRVGQDRVSALAVMMQGLQNALDLLQSRNLLLGYLAIGGSTNAMLATAAFRCLPFGIPKLMVSTTVSGNMAPIIDCKDVVLVHSVVDILGTGSYLRDLMRRSAALMCSLVDTVTPRPTDGPLVVGVTAFGATTAAANRCFDLLSSRGFDVLTFHARGSGGRAAEAFMRDKRIQAMLDLTTTEIADEIVGGTSSAGPERLDAAIELGLPQVLLPGAIDMVNFGPRATIPARFEGRRFLEHTPNVTLMRTTRDEVASIAAFIARKLARAKAPTSVLIPTRGFSAYDVEDGPFFDPDADAAFAETLRSALPANVQLIEIDAHINSHRIAETAVEMLSAALQP